MDKEDVEYFSAIKRNEILPLATTWMDIEGIMLIKINQSQEVTYYMIPFIRYSLKGKIIGTWNLSVVARDCG